jgi:hypothetical protein
MEGSGRRLLLLAVSLLTLALAFVVVVRPWYLQWGATSEERSQSLPGDEIIPRAVYQQTRAITIDAPVDRVWPWLAQLGQDRGGFYSYDVLENLVGCEMPVHDDLRPDKQSWKLGDKLWMYPPEKAGGAGFATLRTFLPGRALGFASRAIGTPLDAVEDGSWSFIVLPIGDDSTRLLIRGRSLRPTSPGPPPVGRLLDLMFFEPIHYVMERRMMIGIRQLAEGKDRNRLRNHLDVALWTITLILFITAAAIVIRRRNHWQRPFAVFVLSGVAFQILTLAQPQIGFGISLVLILVTILRGPVVRIPRTEILPLHRQA